MCVEEWRSCGRRIRQLWIRMENLVMDILRILPASPSYGSGFGVAVQWPWQGPKKIQWLFAMGLEKYLDMMSGEDMSDM